MATQVIRYVDPDAVGLGNGTSWANAYTSLSACLTAEAKNLVLDDQYFTAYCRSSGGTADNTYYAAAGWTTDATHYVEIIGTDFPATGIWDDTKYRLVNDNANFDGIFWNNNAGYFTFRNIQIKVIVPANQLRYGIRLANAGAFIDLDSCIFRGDCTGSGQGYGVAAWGGASVATLRAWNCVGYGFISASNPGDADFAAFYNGGANAYFYNCTSYSNYYGFQHAGTSTTCINCASGNNTDDFSGAPTVDYCCSDDGDGTNAQGPSGGSWTNEFNDAAAGDFSLKRTGNCASNGTTDPSTGLYSDDIIGTLRTVPWSIGAYQVSGAGVPQKFHHYNKNAGGC